MCRQNISRGRLMRKRVEFLIYHYLPPHRRKKKVPDKRFSGAYGGTYRNPLKIGYRFRGEK